MSDVSKFVEVVFPLIDERHKDSFWYGEGGKYPTDLLIARGKQEQREVFVYAVGMVKIVDLDSTEDERTIWFPADLTPAEYEQGDDLFSDPERWDWAYNSWFEVYFDIAGEWTGDSIVLDEYPDDISAYLRSLLADNEYWNGAEAHE